MIDLVTGAGGFLGGRLARCLAADGREVRVLLRGDRLPEHLAGLPIQPRFADLEDASALVKALKGVDVVYHCAACSKDWAPWSEYRSSNILGVANLIRAAREHGNIRRFVHVSTTDVYGYPRIPCDEDGPLVDVGLPYNRSKILGETEVWQSVKSGFPATVIRPASIYGPRSKDFAVEIDKLLAQRMMMYVDGGKVGGGFVYVDDVVDAMRAAAATEVTMGKAYNIAPETDSTWRDYVEALAGELGHPLPWISFSRGIAYGLGAVSEGLFGLLRLRSRPPLTRHAANLLSRSMSFPSGRASRDFGFSPKVGLKEGVARTADWLKRRKA